jgi:AAA ATPase domain
METSKINMRDTFFELPARRRALQQLKSAAERSKYGGKEIVFISGPPGSGKSTLVKSLRNDDLIFFSSANFDKMDTLPFAAITSLLVDTLISICENESLKRKMMDSMTSQMTQQEIKALNKFCPEFHRLGSWDKNEFTTETSHYNQFNRVGSTSLAEIQFVISSFLKILSIQSGEAITLCFFGIHWADEPSISILDFLLEDLELNRFLFVFTYIEREDIPDKYEERAHFYNWKTDIKIRVTQTPICLHLENLRIDDLSTILASSMKLSDIDILAFAAVLMIRTKGNLFFALQIFES